MIRFSAVLVAAWFVCPPAMATTSCDKVSGDAVIADMKAKSDRDEDWMKVGLGKMTEADATARSAKRSDGAVEARITLYQQNCSKGETLQIDSSWGYSVKVLCDFNKSILNLGKQTLCVMK